MIPAFCDQGFKKNPGVAKEQLVGNKTLVSNLSRELKKGVESCVSQDVILWEVLSSRLARETQTLPVFLSIPMESVCKHRVI